MLVFKCTAKDFPVIDMFLHSQEYEEEPKSFKNIKITLDTGEEMWYNIHKEFDKWYIVTA